MNEEGRNKKRDKAAIKLIIVLLLAVVLLAVLANELRSLRDYEVRLLELEERILSEQNELSRAKSESQENLAQESAVQTSAPTSSGTGVILGPMLTEGGSSTVAVPRPSAMPEPDPTPNATMKPVETPNPTPVPTLRPVPTLQPSAAPTPKILQTQPFVCVKTCVAFASPNAGSVIVAEFLEGEIIDVAGEKSGFYLCLTQKGTVYVWKENLENTVVR